MTLASILVYSLTLTVPPLLGPPSQAGAEQTSAERAPLLDHQKLVVSMHRLETQYPGLVSILGVGTSGEGKKIEALRLMAGDREPGRPAILVVANLDGPWVYTSGLVLDHARKLAAAYGDDPAITALLDRVTVYLVPRVNPDAAEARFASPLAERAATGWDVDDDRDGRLGENGVSDVDGDGLVTWMRVPDPDGTWIEDPTDPRAQVQAERAKGQRGKFLIVREGLDTDGDELASEDGLHATHVNRNFPNLWQEHDPAAGRFPTDEPESRALCDFVLRHNDIALVVSYGELDEMVDPPKPIADDARPNKRVPPPGILQSDADLLAEIAKRYRELNDRKVDSVKDRSGTFQAWCYADRGLFAVNIAPWTLPQESPDKKPDKNNGEDGGEGQEKKKDKKDEPKPSDDAKRLAWIDANDAAERFVPWHAFEHPELGSVEIGGFAPYALIEPPDDVRAELADSLLEFLVYTGGLLARVELTDCTARDLGGGLIEVKAALVNPSFLPMQSKQALGARSIRPARVQVDDLPIGAELVAGERRTLVSDLPGSGGRHELRWLVRGADVSKITLRVDTDHAGTDQATPEVK